MGFYTMLQIKKAEQARKAPLLTKCQAFTKNGNPCKNEALLGEEYCKTHKKG